MKRLLLLFSLVLAFFLAVSKEKSSVVTTSSTRSSIALAKHLRSSGAVKYSVHWCPYCHKQNQLFGKKAASILRIVECEPNGKINKLCKQKGIIGYPSWEINGIIESGIKSLDVLAELSNYDGEKDF